MVTTGAVGVGAVRAGAVGERHDSTRRRIMGPRRPFKYVFDRLHSMNKLSVWLVIWVRAKVGLVLNININPTLVKIFF